MEMRTGMAAAGVLEVPLGDARIMRVQSRRRLGAPLGTTTAATAAKSA